VLNKYCEGLEILDIRDPLIHLNERLNLAPFASQRCDKLVSSIKEVIMCLNSFGLEFQHFQN
jgi:hypothetical protein